ncbi:MAG TPA: DEAD/DEAH box helicase, partial [Hyphomonadaceae bacterium]|nr:DEAD/DEAH box helicase [Hyphomonadaceae bacterium]
MTQFIDFGLAAPLTKTLEDLGYTTPTPIQAQAIPMLLEGHDLLGIAQTGTGKTAAFTLPLLHMLNASQKEGQRPAKSVRGLILAPTRELAVQIADSVREYGKLLGLRSVHVLGGVPINKQIRQLEKGTDILIATPGRLEDLMQQKAVTLNHVTHLILDEADQMLDMG